MALFYSIVQFPFNEISIQLQRFLIRAGRLLIRILIRIYLLTTDNVMLKMTLLRSDVVLRFSNYLDEV